MIVAEQKPVGEILAMLGAGKRILVVGCDSCVTVCLSGGEKEVNVLCSALRMSQKGFSRITGRTVKRQCDREFLEDIRKDAEESDILLSMACGAGCQMLSDFFEGMIVLPALNTLFMGSNEGAGYWLERCLGCGDCVLHITGGICPRVRCAKGLMNGPCGGSKGGKCEVDPEHLECGWNLIYHRLKTLGALDRMMEIQPPRDWSRSHEGGPRRVIREDIAL
ncbi:MAG: methylenetetrahydrofolate reductase C-terminal domain-containing protein [Spirochaetales bacterium]|nr:methylenetetrahydrofolate reductase C-terminal domain-containing protein [Spirochaetales bacterium]